MAKAKAALTVALLLGLCAVGHAAVCGLDEAMELYPCSIENITQPTKECCAGIKAFDAGDCFCLPKMIAYDPDYFNRIKDYAKTCLSDGFVTARFPGDKACPETLPKNGFEEYTSLEQVKKDVENRKPKPPPAPPAKKYAKAAKALTLDLVLSADKALDTAQGKMDFINALAETLGVKPSQIKIGLISKGSTIVAVEIVSEDSAGEIPPAELERLSNQVDTGAITLPAKFGNVAATVAPMPEGNDASGFTDVGKIELPEKKASQSIGDSILGIPRLDFFDGGSEYEGGFEISPSYAASLSFQGAPGFCMAIILLIVMILMLLVVVISKICGMCLRNKCAEAYKPRPYTKKQLLISKGVLVAFSALTAIGCIFIYADGPVLLNGAKDLTGAMSDTVVDLTKVVSKIAGALEDAGKVLTELSDENSNQATELKKQAETVEELVLKAQGDIDDAMDSGAQMCIIVASGILGITIIICVFAFLGIWQVLVFFIVILSILMIVAWVTLGVVAIVTVFADDLCTAMSDYVADPNNSDLASLIPCLDKKTAVKTMNSVRKNVREIIKEVNQQLQEYAGNNPYLKYLCYQYVVMPLVDMCTLEVGQNFIMSPFHKDPYAKFVCPAYHADKLGGITEVYPDAACPFPTQYYSVEVGTFGTDLAALRCPFASVLSDGKTRNDFGLAQCYTQRQIPKDLFDEAADKAKVGQTLLDVVPDVEGLIQCQFVSDAFKAMGGPCDDMVKALLNLYYGFIIIGLGYFCMWVTMMVVITRLQHKDRMTDGDNGDNMPKV